MLSGAMNRKVNKLFIAQLVDCEVIDLPWWVKLCFLIKMTCGPSAVSFCKG
jgi:hypothetical protein